jgi:hypothetical protein
MSWNLEMDLQGIPLLGLPVDLPSGAYEAAVTGTEKTAKNGKESVRFDLVTTEGPVKGAPFSIWVGCDVSLKGNLINWKKALASAGAKAEALDRKLSISDQVFAGKKLYVHVKAKNPDEKDTYDERNFITRESYDTLKRAMAAVDAAHPAGAVATATQAAAPATTPQPKSNGVEALVL